jgi:hypothetical protein
MDDENAIRDRLFATRATTIAGMMAKIRSYDLLDMHEDPENSGFNSLAEDIEALMGPAAALKDLRAEHEIRGCLIKADAATVKKVESTACS